MENIGFSSLDYLWIIYLLIFQDPGILGSLEDPRQPLGSWDFFMEIPGRDPQGFSARITAKMGVALCPFWKILFSCKGKSEKCYKREADLQTLRKPDPRCGGALGGQEPVPTFTNFY